MLVTEGAFQDNQAHHLTHLQICAYWLSRKHMVMVHLHPQIMLSADMLVFRSQIRNPAGASLMVHAMIMGSFYRIGELSYLIFLLSSHSRGTGFRWQRLCKSTIDLLPSCPFF